MKLIYVTTSFPYGPGESFLIPEIEELLRQGNELIIVPMYPRGNIIHEISDLILQSVVPQPIISFTILIAAIRQFIGSLPASFRMLVTILSTFDKKMLKNILFFPNGLWLGNLAYTSRVEHIHSHWVSTTSTMALTASKSTGIPWSFTAHRWDIVDDNLLQPKIDHAGFARFISKSGLGLASKLNRFPANSIVLHMGVNIPINVMPSRSEKGVPVIFCPANLIPVKGHKYLIEAADLLHRRGIKFTLLLAGEGELRADLQGLVFKLSLRNNVTFLGHISHKYILKLYSDRCVDVVVLPSIDLGNGLHEGIPVSLIEAMGFGIPVISTKTGGIPELLEDGAGYLVPPKDPISIADAIEGLVKDEKLYFEFAEKGLARVQENFCVVQVVKKLMDLVSTCSDHPKCVS